MTDEELRALCPYTSRAHAGAWTKGACAAMLGTPRTACPYNRNAVGGQFGNIPTGERGFANAWLRGYDAAKGG